MASLNDSSLLYKVGRGALRIWIAFSISSFSLTVVFSILEGDNPLRSDDPYIAGFIAGVTTAFSSMCWVVADWLNASRFRQHVAYIGPLGAMVVSLVLWDNAWPPIEAQGLPTIMAVIIACGGVVAYPFHLLKPGRIWPALVSSLGVLFVFGYLCAAIHISMVHSELRPTWD